VAIVIERDPRKLLAKIMRGACEALSNKERAVGRKACHDDVDSDRPRLGESGVGSDRQSGLPRWHQRDAGNERSTESFDDLPGECWSWMGLTFPEDQRPGEKGRTAANDDAEGTISLHPSVTGIADLDAEVSGFDGPVALLIVKNLGRQKGGVE
jgi:hypothetical protein